jgi:DNA-binding XRE family transcriptional regulator
MNNKRTETRATRCSRPCAGRPELLDLLDRPALPLEAVESVPDPYVFDDYESVTASGLIISSAETARPSVEGTHSQDLILCNRKRLGGVFKRPSFLRSRPKRGDWSGNLRLSLRWPGRGPLRILPEVVSKELGHSGRDGLSAGQSAMHTSSTQSSMQLTALGRALALMREEQGLSGKQLALAADIPHWRVTAIEEGRLDPTFETLLGLAEAMNISAAAIFQRAEALDREDER